MRTPLGVSAAACVILLGALGCGSSESAGPSSVAAASSSSVAATAPSATLSATEAAAVLPSVADAAVQFKGIGAKYSPALVDFNNLYHGQSEATASWNAACQKVATAYDGYQRDLVGALWPAQVQAKVDAVATALATSRAAYVQCAEAADMPGVYDAIGRRTEELSGALQTLRVALGRPSTS